jgi:hypothetical protein
MLLILMVAMLHSRVQTAESGFERFLSLAALSGLSQAPLAFVFFAAGVSRGISSVACAAARI